MWEGPQTRRPQGESAPSQHSPQPPQTAPPPAPQSPITRAWSANPVLSVYGAGSRLPTGNRTQSRSAAHRLSRVLPSTEISATPPPRPTSVREAAHPTNQGTDLCSHGSTHANTHVCCRAPHFSHVSDLTGHRCFLTLSPCFRPWAATSAANVADFWKTTHSVVFNLLATWIELSVFLARSSHDHHRRRRQTGGQLVCLPGRRCSEPQLPKGLVKGPARDQGCCEDRHQTNPGAAVQGPQDTCELSTQPGDTPPGSGLSHRCRGKPMELRTLSRDGGTQNTEKF